jgi:hypothetical protein
MRGVRRKREEEGRRGTRTENREEWVEKAASISSCYLVGF